MLEVRRADLADLFQLLLRPRFFLRISVVVQIAQVGVVRSGGELLFGHVECPADVRAPTIARAIEAGNPPSDDGQAGPGVAARIRVMTDSEPPEVRRLAEVGEGDLRGLVELLVDCVEGGAS